MEFIRDMYNLRPRHRGCVASIGNYDGVHLGHQAVIRQLARKGQELGLPVTVVTFEPHPQEYFAEDRAPPRLMGFRDKLLTLREAGVDRVLCLRFGARLAATEAEAFVRDYLVAGLGIRYLVVGDDFRFGKDRTGDFRLLETLGRRLGFQVDHMATHVIGGERVSSSRIRRCLARGDLATAAVLLGQPFHMSGHVAHGAKRGRKWGFPTANIFVKHRNVPLTGIFAVAVHGVDGGVRRGVANLGVRPAIGSGELLLEVHLFDFSDDIYGRRLRVDFLHKLRDEAYFSSFDALRKRIRVDVDQAREYFAARDARIAEAGA